MSKTKCVYEEYERLKNLFIKGDESKLELIDELLKKAAFLKVELDDLEKQINKSGSVQTSNKGNTRVSLYFKTYLQTVAVWEQRNVGESAETYSRGTPLVSVKNYYSTSEIPFIRSGKISSNKTELFISNEGLNNSSAKLVKQGDILYALYGATSGEVSISLVNGAINQAILAILPKSCIDNRFLMYWLRKSKSNITKTFLQGGQGNLSGEIIKSLEFSCGSLREQEMIGDTLEKLDNLITLHQRKQYIWRNHD